MLDIKFISDFLNKDGVEGPRVIEGYIPCYIRGTNNTKSANFKGRPDQNPDRFQAMGASGVTIATGVDLGQTDAVTLREYGVDKELVEQLAPYIGLKRDAAIRKLSQEPLRINPSDAEQLDNCVHAGYLRRFVRPAYDKASDVSFDELPIEAQAVVFSCCYQKGCGGVRRDWPKLWSYLTSQDWCAASRELKNGFKQYKLRRRIEGELLAGLC